MISPPQINRIFYFTIAGYFVKVWGAPVGKEQIQSQYIQDNVDNDVGLKDLMKLHAFNFDTFPTVILVDYSTLVMQPLDSAVQAFQASSAEIAYTKNYAKSGANPDSLSTGIDTGLLLLKPSKVTHATLIETYKIASYDPIYGWNGSEEAPDVGGFDGALGTSGILTYYYRHQPSSAMELKELSQTKDRRKKWL